MPRKSKKEEGKELDERIAQLKLLVAEKKKKEQSKEVSSNLKEEILGKKKAKAQEKISKDRKWEISDSKDWGDVNIRLYNDELKEEILKKKKAKAQEKIGFDRRFEVSDSKDFGDVNIRLYNDKLKNELKAEILRKKKAKAQEKISKDRRLDKPIAEHMRDFNLKEYEEKQELELRQEKLMKEREDQVFKKEIYKLIKEKYFSHKGQYVYNTFGIYTNEVNNLMLKTKGRNITDVWTIPELKNLAQTFHNERMKQQRIRRMNKSRDNKAKEDYIKNNQVLKKYGIKNLKDAKSEVDFWGRVLGKIDNKEMFDLRGNEYFTGSAEWMPFPLKTPEYQAVPYPDPNKSSYKTIVNLFYPPFKRIVERYLDKDLGDDYEFQKTLPTRGEIANLVDSVNTVIDRYSTITSKKKITRADYTSDEYDTDSTVASDYFSEIDSDSDFEGKLDREDKPLKQGRLTVVEDKPRVFIDDKSFLF